MAVQPPIAPRPVTTSVAASDPRRFVRHGATLDGTPLLIRPIRPDDARGEQAFVRALSPGSRRKRFGNTLNELSPAMLERFTRIDPTRETALIALAGSDECVRQVGVARYVIDRDGRSGEFALVVSDELHQCGIGTRLMRRLLDAARDHGLERLRGEVQADNREMLGFMASLGFSAHPHSDDRQLVIVERIL